MNTLRRLSLTLSLVSLSGAAFAVPVCNVSTTCETPAATSQSPTINASSLLGLQSLNSVGPNGNQTNSNYFFAVTSTDLGPTVASITNSGTGLQVVGVTPTHNAVATPSSAVGAGAVQGTKGGTAYYLYAQACPAATAANGTNCSLWGKVSASQITTTAYPLTVFSNPVKPTDASVNSIAVRTNVPAGDVSNVSVIALTIDDLITSANNQTIAPITYVGNGSPYTIDNSLYTNGFIPNTKYQYQGQVQYPWDLVPVAGVETKGPFWTTPATPGTVSAAVVTHCSAQITALNSSGAPANPSYTTYNLCASGSGGSCTTQAVSGGTPTDSAFVTISGLTPGTSYTPTGQALVGNGDGTSTGWNSSAVRSGSVFSTLGFAGTFSIASIGTNSANFTFSGLDLTGVIGYQMIVNGSNFGAQVNSAPVSPISLAGLAPNTQYSVQIKLIEASCNSTLPVSPPASGTQFYTRPVAPTGGTLTAPGPRTMTAGWTDVATPTGNPNGSTYSVLYCTDAAFTLNCNTQGATKSNTTPSASLTTGVFPETQYFAKVKTIGLGGVDSAYLDLGNVTTPNEAPSIASGPTATVYVSSAALVTLGSDYAGEPSLVYRWSVISAPAGAVAAFTANGTNAAKNNFITLNKIGSYTVGVYSQDHNGSGLTSSTSTVVFSVNQVVSGITVSPNPATVPLGNTQSFTFTSIDQFGGAMSPAPTITWSTTGPGSINSASGLYTAPNSGSGSATVTATALNGVSGSATVNLTAGAPTVATPAAIAPNPVTSTTGALSVLGADDGGEPALTYTWATIISPTGSSVGFSVNSSNSAKNVTATFNTAGAYTVGVTIQDVPGNTVTSSVSFNVNQTSTTIVVTPKTNPTIGTGQTQQFTAAVTDQFGHAIVGTGVAWGVSGGGSISTTGLFTATTVGGPFTVTGTAGAVSDTAQVTVAGSVPVFVSTPTISPNPVTGTAAQLNASGSGFGGHTIDYTWTVISAPNSAPVEFSSNGTPTSGNPIVTFHKAGDYTLRATLTDTAFGTTVTRDISFTVLQTLSRISVSPDNVTVQGLNDQIFTASGVDQFGNTMTPPNLTWSTNIGRISGTGQFTPSTLGSNIVVTAHSGSLTGSARVSVVDYNVSGAYAYPVPYKSTFGTQLIYFKGLGTSAKIRIYTATGREVFSTTIDNADPVKGWGWNVKNNSGDNVASGVYFYFIESPAGKKDGKLIIIQ